MYKKQNIIWRGIIVLICCGVFLIMLAQAISVGLNTLNLIPKPERFTELYFKDPAALPRYIVVGQPIKFSFIIHNLEGVTTIYPYRVYFRYPSGSQITYTSGEVTVDDGTSIMISESWAATSTNEQVRVVVELISLNQQIDFLLPNNS